MNIAVIGTGYAGLVTGVCLAEIGNDVTCIDIDEVKLEKLRSGNSPIFEEGLEELLQKGIHRNKLHFTSSYEEGLADKEIVMISVGTPQSEDGSADLSTLHTACKNIGDYLHNDTVIVTKSTVPIGTNEQIKKMIEHNSPANISVKIVSNPEFLRQGSAVHDTFYGDRIVLGSEDKGALQQVERLYKPFGIPIIKTDTRSAEMIKYASNAFLATKISFINEIANLCEHAGANVDDVANGIGMDERIGKHFLKAGIGYGGSCFPKDTSAIITFGKNLGRDMPILESVNDVNEKQHELLIIKIMNRFGNLQNKTIALLGLAFKPGTDDMRNAPSITVVQKILNAGATIKAFDPAAVPNAKRILPKEIKYAETMEEALDNTDCAVILTDWKEIKEYPINNFKKYLNNPIIFDGRNCFSLDEMEASGIEYQSIGRPSVNTNS
ncbi:UDP-glucose dehydrogenase family protein [Virgibacillus doumboii]|uniref:UDP-glucose dehydrogenase family protein n=1 Tax=Virgibacillus doumboii TaxID=2697503 RepID=UPI0013DEF76E|nr:UDP-glucose/GDP-mannose dehydrogenase family protein [Virgibacillus doumboii]